VATHPETRISLEMLDMAQYNNFKNRDRVKLRVRHNADLIEAGFYEYVEVDVYGILDAPGWGEFENSNRTLDLAVLGELEPSIGSDVRVAIQNTRNAL
jgi:hypothetical protein